LWQIIARWQAEDFVCVCVPWAQCNESWGYQGQEGR
jgi:hypothetical protein